MWKDEHRAANILLVSFANRSASEQEAALVAIDLASDSSWRVETTPPLRDFEAKGITGLAVCDEGYLMCLQNWESSRAPNIIKVDRHFKVRAGIRETSLVELHGLTAHNEIAHVVSTYDDCVVSIDVTSMTILEHVRFRPRPMPDYLHINDICRTPDGRLIASHFGRRNQPGVRGGGLLDVRTGEQLFGGLREPHSVQSVGDLLYVLESATGDLLEIDPRGWTDPKAYACGYSVTGRFLGYPRGLAISGGLVAIGRSAYRTRSNSCLGFDRRAPVGVEGVDSESWGATGVYCLRKGEPAVWFDLAKFGSEIYSVVAIPAEWEEDVVNVMHRGN